MVVSNSDVVDFFLCANQVARLSQWFKMEKPASGERTWYSMDAFMSYVESRKQFFGCTLM